MSTGMTFRRTCERCGGTFFAPDRRLAVCAKCVKRLGLRRGTPPSRAAPQRPTSPTPTRVPSPPSGRTSRAQSPLPNTLTEELRQAILEAYDPEGRHRGLSEAAVNARIASTLKVRRRLVSEALAPLRPSHACSRPPTPEEVARIVEIYQGYVLRNERPPLGRHRTIARELGLSLRRVVEVLRDWRRENTDLLARRDRFLIEQSYWRQLDQGGGWTEVVSRVAEETRRPRWAVARWLDQLLEDPRAAAAADALPPETRDAVERAFREYLRAEDPPDGGLHEALAQRFNLTPKQVHAVLVAYRLRHKPVS